MRLAVLIATDEDALICDFAEFYHVYNYRAIGLQYAAVLAGGLDDRSRVVRKLNGQAYPIDTLLRAAAVDKLSLLVWFKTKDGAKGINQPKSILDVLLNGEEKLQEEIRGFQSVEEFEAARRRILGETDGSGN